MFPLLLLSLSSTIVSSRKLLLSQLQLRGNDFKDVVVELHQNENVRDLYEVQAIEVDEEPCMSIPAVVNETTYEPTTKAPTASPIVSS